MSSASSNDNDMLDAESLHGTLGDDHQLTRRAATYGERVITGDDWPLDDVDLRDITWETSTRARRRHGVCIHHGDGDITIRMSQHTYDRAGFESCKTTIRHELVHAWQYQQPDEPVVVNGVEVIPEPGHGNSFRVWNDLLDLDGRCSSHYTRQMEDYAYVYECLDCGYWVGRHRLCKSVRQAATGGEGTVGYRYCQSCEAMFHLRNGDLYLPHANHSDATIRRFATGDDGDVVQLGRPAQDIDVNHDV